MLSDAARKELNNRLEAVWKLFRSKAPRRDIAAELDQLLTDHTGVSQHDSPNAHELNADKALPYGWRVQHRTDRSFACGQMVDGPNDLAGWNLYELFLLLMDFSAEEYPLDGDDQPLKKSLARYLHTVTGRDYRLVGDSVCDREAAAHSTDFRSVRWRETDFTFTEMQAACVKVLWENWEQGTPDVADKTVLDAAGGFQTRLDHVFNRGKHAAWGTMIRQGGTRGTHRIGEPDL